MSSFSVLTMAPGAGNFHYQMSDELPESESLAATTKAMKLALSNDAEFFSAEERKTLEALVAKRRAKPGYEYLRGCLVWPDEFPSKNDDETFYWKVTLLQSYRSMMWRPEYHEKTGFVGEWFKAAQNAWNKAQASGLKWIGFLPARTDPKNLKLLTEFEAAEFGDF